MEFSIQSGAGETWSSFFIHFFYWLTNVHILKDIFTPSLIRKKTFSYLGVKNSQKINVKLYDKIEFLRFHS